MVTIKGYIVLITRILLGIIAGVAASYLLVIKGIKAPAAILGIIGFVGVGILGYNWIWDPRFWYLPGNIYRPRSYKSR
jgi:hypothetical protein